MRENGSDEKFCSECASVIKVKAELCPACGVRQMSRSLNKDKGVATLFCFFLGAFGAHKFYLGQIGRGIVYLLFAWTFVPAVLAFIEFLLLTLMSEDTFYERYDHSAVQY